MNAILPAIQYRFDTAALNIFLGEAAHVICKFTKYLASQRNCYIKKNKDPQFSFFLKQISYRIYSI